jgi:hypothetical protein
MFYGDFKLRQITVPDCLGAQKLLNSYKKKNRKRSELKRILYSKKFCLQWEKEKIPFILPAVPKRQDYWYLVQLFSMNRHLNDKGNVYKFDMSREEKIYIESEDSNEDIWLKLLSMAKLNNKNLSLSRNDLNKILKLYGGKLLDIMGINNNSFKIVPVPFDIFLRTDKLLRKNIKTENIFFDGYRQRTDGKIMAIFGGNIYFGGRGYIDSIWMDLKYKSIYPKLIIIRKDYGY